MPEPESQDPFMGAEPKPPSVSGRLGSSVWLMVMLLVGGLLLAGFADTLGVALVKQCEGQICTWDNARAMQTADGLRLLGGMVFAAGLVERLVIALGPRD